MSKHSIEILSIYCKDTGSRHTDGVYLEIQADAGVQARLPNIPGEPLSVRPMSNGETWYLTGSTTSGRTFNFDHLLTVAVWDQDIELDPSSATFLVNFNWEPTGTPTDFTTKSMVNVDGANYTIKYRILD